MLILAGDPTELLPTVRSVAQGAVLGRRVRVLQGDRGSESFPTGETTATIRRFFNKGGSAADPADRVREIAVVIHNYYSRTHATTTVETRLVALARDIGYASERVQSVRTASTNELIAALTALGMCDVPPIPPPPTTLEAAITKFGSAFDDALVSQRALQSAVDFDVAFGGFPDAEQVVRDLRAVHQIYGRLTDLDGSPVKPRDRVTALARAIGQTLGSEDDATAKADRTFTFPDFGNHTLDIRLHLRYSYQYARIYLWFAGIKTTTTEEPIRTVVGHAGKHLP